MGALTLIYGLWQFWHRGMSPAESAYTKMVRSGRLLGVKRKEWQTPTEYAAAIGDVVPDVADAAMMIAIEFERRRYASPNTASTTDGLPGQWRRVLRGLLGYRMRLITRTRPALGESRSRA